MELTELEMEIEREKGKQMIDVESGAYAEDMLEDLKNYRGGTGSEILHALLAGSEDARITLRLFYEDWKEAKAYELSRANCTPD